MAEVLSERLLARASFRELRFSKLFSDYCDAVPDAVAFYGHHFRDGPAIASSLRNARSLPTTTRSVLADVLREQNTRWSAPPATMANIDRLAESGSACVVTGQQLGLFVSPLYTIYKSLTAIRLAAEWSKSDSPVVPVFWLAGEDHDVDEIARCYVPGIGGTVSSFEYPDPPVASNAPTGSLVLDDSIVSVIDSLERQLPESGDRAAVVESLRKCYRPGVSFNDAFASFLHVLLPDSGIVILSASDRRLKKLAVPLFRRAIEEADELHSLLGMASNSVAENYHAQVQLRNTNLFMISDGHRAGLDRVDGGFEFKSTRTSFSLDEIVAELKVNPEAFSPNVVLRPLYQDTILPTAAYVGGPGEVAYFGQLRGAYEWAGIKMPIVYPRASISLVDGSAIRLLDAEKLELSQLRKRPDVLFGELVAASMSIDVPAEIGIAAARINEGLDGLSTPASSIHPTLETSVEAIRATIVTRLERLQRKMIREEKRKHTVLGNRIARSASFLFPFGSPQERVLLPAYFVARYGSAYFMRLLEDIDLDTSRHLVLRA